MKVLVVVPALNEEKALPALLDELQRTRAAIGIDLQALVVDDGSSDATAAVARQRGARVIRLCRNLGIGAAVQTGLRVALREGFDAAVQMDGDGQHPPGELHKLLAGCKGPTPPEHWPADMPDMIVGTRYLEREGFNSTPLRRLGSWWLKKVLGMLARRTITDPTSGYRVYGPRALELFDRNYPYDYPEPEALAIALAAGLRVSEVAVVMRERQGGASSIFGLRAPYYMLKVTLAVLLAYARNVRRRARGKVHAAV